MGRALEQLVGEAGVVSHVGGTTKSDVKEKERNFVDILDGMKRVAGDEFKGLTFADILQQADLMSETTLEVLVKTSQLPFC